MNALDYSRAEFYQRAYLADYGFEAVMVRYRRTLMLERLDLHQPRTVIEIGCGAELLYQAWCLQGRKVGCWVVVEPAEHFAGVARTSGLPNLHVVQNYCEAAQNDIRRVLPTPPDMVICSALLHEVPSAKELLTAIRALMGDRTLLHVNVPNAGSLHRRLARTMGLIQDTREMSERNIKLQQHRVYDTEMLLADLAAVGLVETERGGIFVKPFSHRQMEAVAPLLGEAVLDGLYRLGRELPELASEIFLEARRRCPG